MAPGASSWGHLVRHVSLESVILGFPHASAAAWFPWNLSWVVVLMCVAYLCSLDTSSPWFAGAATTSADTLPSLCWRMLCRPCYARFGGYFATLATPTLADAFAALFALLIGRLRRMLRRCGAASSGGYLATLWLFSWSQSAASVMLIFM